MDVLVVCDTFRSAELRHEVPLGVPDAFVYLERDGRRHVRATSSRAPAWRRSARRRPASSSAAGSSTGSATAWVVTEDGCEVLTGLPYDLEVLGS